MADNILDSIFTLDTSNILPINVKQLCLDCLTRSSFPIINLDGSSCGDFRFRDEHLSFLLDCLDSADIKLSQLSLRFHKLSSKSLERIASHMNKSSSHANSTYNFHSLNLEGNEINGDFIESLCLSSDNCTIELLNLSSNPLGFDGGNKLINAIYTNRSLKHLYLNNCEFPLNTIIGITSALTTKIGSSSNYNDCILQTLEIDRPIKRNSSVKEEMGTDHLSRLIPFTAHTPLSKLSLKYHMMEDFGAKLLADSISRNYGNLISLNLECNFIGVGGAEAIASCLIMQSKSNCVGLQVLKLSYNRVGNEGAEALADALKSSTSLVELTLKSNSIDKGLVAIGKALEVNNSIKKIALFGNDFDANSGKVFFDLIKNRLNFLETKIDVSVYIVDGIFHVGEVSI
jgi:hypothetical protein